MQELPKISNLKNNPVFKKDSRLLKFNSVNFEISVIYTLILGLILISFSTLFYFVTSNTLYDELDNELRVKSEGVISNINSYLNVKGEKPQTLRYAVEQVIAREGTALGRWWFVGFERSWFKSLNEQDLSSDFVNFISLNKSFIVNSKNLDEQNLRVFLDNAGLLNGQAVYWNADTIGKGGLRVINYPYYTNGEATHVLQVGISKGPIIQLLKEWMASVAISIPIILFLTGFIGKLLASRILSPLYRIIDTAAKISHENLNLRVEPKFHYHEMDYLIRTFNDMLTRLEQSFKHIDEFSTHVAHELKTPLTIIRGEAELSYLSAKSKENKQSLRVIMDEIDIVLKTIEALLFLGKMRFQPEALDLKDHSLNKFLQIKVDHFKHLVAKKNIRLEFHKLDPDVVIRADEIHLRRLFFNILDNAFKFTPEGGQITIDADVSGDRVYIHIKDSGPGISPDDISKVFAQFFHADHAQKGTGLGLSIAQAVAKAHYGDITVKSSTSAGTTFTVELPIKRTLSATLKS